MYDCDFVLDVLVFHAFFLFFFFLIGLVFVIFCYMYLFLFVAMASDALRKIISF